MKSYCLTDTGKKRNMNQDFVYASEQRIGAIPNLFIVADGMGGHNAGDLASRLAVETMVDHIGSSGNKRTLMILSEAVDAANRSVYLRSLTDKALTGMGTTVVACCVEGESLYVVNVGDSRLYIIRDDIYQITRDHSLVEEMVQAGQITAEEAKVHPDRNVITRAVGMKDQSKPDLLDVGIRQGDRILLCSDGLSNMVSDRQIYDIIMESASIGEAAVKLKDTANDNGGSDNISVILIELDE
ncbi:MAG: Stp1/IreP family PP2C-type Ser/Thr phosphatase [Lachnospiraceae bacterium]|nr:Stp1/IreP family PP2C-type Ser/Thr phosphatase [Lachnospiraceae bacterium]